ncbi:hypothetical protein NHX12_034300 [Muraenolepis orangiensis]|uniref:Sushi domain-containing protein n=1 Tax=Muraenolepis orangiensis TaxID=630683 RepID=A0A9Q0D350_9TELE|nr:hypothetical protein NHX12_034300 [Muraenolepis orangiensis]
MATITTGPALVLLLLQVLGWLAPGLACFCERYPWSSWSFCSRTCNYGTQQRTRNYVYENYFWKNNCQQFCEKYESRACNRPSQFGGEACSGVLAERRPCHPDTECRLPKLNCKEQFQCDNGRCINATLTCNTQNDCEDNSDERDCGGSFTAVCPTERRVPPGPTSSFDAMAEASRAPVLSNRFMGGGECLIQRPESIILYYRVGVVDDFKDQVSVVTSTKMSVNRAKTKKGYREAFEASRQSDSVIFRVHQLLPVSTFKLRAPRDLVLSGPFLQFLNALPLEYNYPLYREIFQHFGTHYYGSGTLGGKYEMLYQYDTEMVTSSGSYTNAARKSHSMVEGGQAREAQKLVFSSDATPPRDAFSDWSQSVIQVPYVVDYQRRLLRRALVTYLEEFDVCKCVPCPNNAVVVLAGTECRCLCKTGTFGANCEKKAPGYTAEAEEEDVRGQPCQGPNIQLEPCHFSIFEKQTTCDNDDDFTMGWKDELPPGVVGCFRAERPANSYLLKAKPYFEVGENEEFQCFTGMQNDGSPFISCLPDLTWSQPNGRCIKELQLYPDKKEYRVEESVGLNCLARGMVPAPRGAYRCTYALTWEPPIPSNLHCVDAKPYVPEWRCGPGQKRQGSDCVCVDRESCLSYHAELCALNVDLDTTVSMSVCSFQAGRCHGDPFVFVNMGQCDGGSAARLDWVRFRRRLSVYSVAQVPCGVDTCYDWETCDAAERTQRTCVCSIPQDCPRDQGPTFCMKLTASNRTRSTKLCVMGAFKCSSIPLEFLHEGPCGDS